MTIRTLAIVGASSGLGLHIAETLTNTSSFNSKWRLIVLSRTAKPITSIPKIPVIGVSYEPENAQHLVQTLRSNDVHTIICTIGALDESLVQCQKAVLDAAVKSRNVKRFIPSEFVGERCKSVTFLRDSPPSGDSSFYFYLYTSSR